MEKDKPNVASEASGQISENMTPLQILELAIYNEQSAYDFYLDLSSQIENQSGREKFGFLAQDEKRHKGLLEGQYQRESKGEKLGFDPKRVKYVKVKVDTQSSATDALDLAIQAEREAYKFYTQASQETKDQSGKSLFLKLAEDEDKHYNLLSAERQALSNNFYWYGYDVPGVMEE